MVWVVDLPQAKHLVSQRYGGKRYLSAGPIPRWVRQAWLGGQPHGPVPFILDAEIQDGRFAREWILENKAGAPSFKALRRQERRHDVEEVGRQLRRLMSWIDAKEV